MVDWQSKDNIQFKFGQPIKRNSLQLVSYTGGGQDLIKSIGQTIGKATVYSTFAALKQSVNQLYYRLYTTITTTTTLT